MHNTKFENFEKVYEMRKFARWLSGKVTEAMEENDAKYARTQSNDRAAKQKVLAERRWLQAVGEKATTLEAAAVDLGRALMTTLDR